MIFSASHHQLLCAVIAVISPVISLHLKKTSVFNSGSVELDGFAKIPATLTIPLYDCSSSYRPKPDIPDAYEVYHNYEWHVHFCQDGLIWNETLCRCHYPDGNIPSIQCKDFRAASMEPSGKYKQFVNGLWIIRHCSHATRGLVWNQEVCQCVWNSDSKISMTGKNGDSCDVMLNMTFEDGIVDHGKNSFIEMRKKDQIKILSLEKKESFGGNTAAFFNDTALKIWYFAGNEMGTSLRVNFRFKLNSTPINEDKYQMFISNGCRGSTVGYTTPSLAIGHRPVDQTYVLAFETASARKTVVCSSQWNPYNWHVVSLVYNDGTLVLSVNDRLCLVSQDFSGPIQKTHCPLTVGTDPLIEGSVFKGYLDDLLIARHCRTNVTDQRYSETHGNGPIPVKFSANRANRIKEQGTNIANGGRFLEEMKGVHHSRLASTKYMSKLSKRMNTPRANTEKPHGRTSSRNVTEIDDSSKIFAKVGSYTKSLDNLVALGHSGRHDTKVRRPGSEFKIHDRNTGQVIETVNNETNGYKADKMKNTTAYSDKIMRKLNKLTHLIKSDISGNQFYSSKTNSKHEVDYVKLKGKPHDKNEGFENRKDSSSRSNVSFNLGNSTQFEDDYIRNKKSNSHNKYFMEKNGENVDDTISKTLSKQYSFEKSRKNSHIRSNVYDSHEQTPSNVYQEKVKTKIRNNNVLTESNDRENMENYFATVSKDRNIRYNDFSGETKNKSTRGNDFAEESKDRSSSEQDVYSEIKDLINKHSYFATESKERNSRDNDVSAEFIDTSTRDNDFKTELKNRSAGYYDSGIEFKDSNTKDNDFASETRLYSHIPRGIQMNNAYLLGDDTTSMEGVANVDMYSRKPGRHGKTEDTHLKTSGKSFTDGSDRLVSSDHIQRDIMPNEHEMHILANEYDLPSGANVLTNDRDHIHSVHVPNTHVSHHDTRGNRYRHKHRDSETFNGLKNTIRDGDIMTSLNSPDYNDKVTGMKFTDKEEKFERKSSSVILGNAFLTDRKHEVDDNALILEHSKPDLRGHDRVGMRWYDVVGSPQRLRQAHLIGIDLSHGSAFIIDRNYRRNQKSLWPKPNFIKGRRRSGSKKNNWYDKADT